MTKLKPRPLTGREEKQISFVTAVAVTAICWQLLFWWQRPTGCSSSILIPCTTDQGWMALILCGIAAAGIALLVVILVLIPTLKKLGARNNRDNPGEGES